MKPAVTSHHTPKNILLRRPQKRTQKSHCTCGSKQQQRPPSAAHTQRAPYLSPSPCSAPAYPALHLRSSGSTGRTARARKACRHQQTTNEVKAAPPPLAPQRHWFSVHMHLPSCNPSKHQCWHRLGFLCTCICRAQCKDIAMLSVSCAHAFAKHNVKASQCSWSPVHMHLPTSAQYKDISMPAPIWFSVHMHLLSHDPLAQKLQNTQTLRCWHQIAHQSSTLASTAGDDLHTIHLMLKQATTCTPAPHCNAGCFTSPVLKY
jgi:hypothetical protein